MPARALPRFAGRLPIGTLLLLLACLPARLPAQDAAEPVQNADTSAATVASADAEFFQRDVRPILEQHCYKCHGAQAEVKGGLRLSNRADILHGGDSGPAVDLEQPEQSPLLAAVRYETFEMPPNGKLPPEKIAILAEWVARGAHFAPGTEQRADAEPAHQVPQVNEQTKQFWSFQPVHPTAVPDVVDRGWVRSPIDAFILTQLEAAGLRPAPMADKRTLLRRVTYDLTGLPPTAEELSAFLADESPAAFARVVDRLLASPRYGERWGRHWLDLVRYAETNSFERDGAKPHVWRYRDYVIDALNQDMPYDQFIREQLAGDELDEVTADSIVATGFYRLGPWDDEPADPKQAHYDDLDDILSTSSQVFLGLTISCARCHDHKLDPIPQADYYRMLAFFANVRRYGVRAHETVLDASVRPIASEAERREHQQAVEDHGQRRGAIEQQLAAIEALVLPTFSPVDQEEFRHRQNRVMLVRRRVPETISAEQAQQYAELQQAWEQLERNPPPGLAAALCVTEPGSEAPPTHVLIRGNPHVTGALVEPGFPSVLSPPPPHIVARSVTSGRRRAVAEWIASADNPLTARVMVNRVWQYHFGRGIVRSSNNFGAIGDRPTHPELLDWLAAAFVADGWQLKSLHRRMLLSSAYQMSSAASAEGLAQDPENNLFWRFDMRRLTAEEIRDSILAANGSLNISVMGGPSFYPQLPEEVLHTQSQPGAGWGHSSPAEQARRSVYAHVKRSLLTPLLARFDAADVDATCPVRFVTTLPTQALTLLNSDAMQRDADTFATFVRQHAGDAARDQVALALERVTQRTPSEAEVQQGATLLEQLQRDEGLGRHEALRFFCLLALNLNEFIYLD